MNKEYDEGDYEDYATCDSVGMGGNCGEDCPVFLRGDCSEQENAIEDIIKTVFKDNERTLESYDENIQEMIECFIDAHNYDIDMYAEIKEQKNIITDFDRAMEIL